MLLFYRAALDAGRTQGVPGPLLRRSGGRRRRRWSARQYDYVVLHVLQEGARGTGAVPAGPSHGRASFARGPLIRNPQAHGPGDSDDRIGTARATEALPGTHGVVARAADPACCGRRMVRTPPRFPMGA